MRRATARGAATSRARRAATPARWGPVQPWDVLTRRVTRSLGKYPVDEVVDLGLVLRLDDRVILFVAVLELHLLARRDVLGDARMRFRLALVLGGHVLVRRAFLLLVDGMALEAVALSRELLRGGRIDAPCVGRKRKGYRDRGDGEGTVQS